MSNNVNQYIKRKQLQKSIAILKLFGNLSIQSINRESCSGAFAPKNVKGKLIVGFNIRRFGHHFIMSLRGCS